jgi:hypothetical protein
MSLDQLEFYELVRRGREDDRILNLPKQDQKAARLAEASRRSNWDSYLTSLKNNQSSNSQLSSSSSNQSLPHISNPSTTPAPIIPTSTSLQNTPGTLFSGTSRSLKRLKRLLGWKS